MEESDRFVGKVVLVGIQLYRHDGTYLRNTQIHGVISEVNPEQGIVFREALSGREFFLPPAFDYIHAAPPGVYRERDSGFEVENPDFVTQWAVLLPEGADETEIEWSNDMTWSAGPPPDVVRDRIQ